MSSIGTIKLWLGILFSTVMVSLAYELKFNITEISSQQSKALIISISIIMSGFLTNTLITFLLSFSLGRKFLMHNGWVEGYWEWRTYNKEEDNIQVAIPGIMYLSYYGKELELRAIVNRPNLNNGVAQNTSTEYASIRDYDGRYFNYATFPKGDSEQKAYAVGRFFKDSPLYHPNIYEGLVMVEDGMFNQSGRKIPENIVNKYKDKFGNKNWIKEYVKENMAS